MPILFALLIFFLYGVVGSGIESTLSVYGQEVQVLEGVVEPGIDPTPSVYGQEVQVLEGVVRPGIESTPSVYGQEVQVHTCLNRLNVPAGDIHWVYIPEFANQLHTEEKYFYLAGQLIKNKIVDASACPAGGLALNEYANACGMVTAMPTVIGIQNMVNEPVMQAWINVGIPPVMLKQLIRIESQFWPAPHAEETVMYGGNQTAHAIEFGYGHITNIGLRNALQWNTDLGKKICPPSAYGFCASDVSNAYQILSSLGSVCPTCEYGVDPVMVNREVDILAEVLLGHCNQTAQLIFNATGWRSNLVVDYGTIWKLTLMNYNAGPGCVFDTVVSTFKITEGPMDWSEISANVTGAYCMRGLSYANQVTARYFDFPP